MTSETNKNKCGFISIMPVMILCLVHAITWAQSPAESALRNHRNSVYIGAGPNIYFNNLVFLKNEVHELNYSFVGRYMWEPEHLLTIGFETGYYRLYRISLS